MRAMRARERLKYEFTERSASVPHAIDGPHASVVTLAIRIQNSQFFWPPGVGTVDSSRKQCRRSRFYLARRATGSVIIVRHSDASSVPNTENTY